MAIAHQGDHHETRRSISLGSSKRDSTVELDLLGQRVCIQRMGTDGDMARAAALYAELDGQVDAFGVGGTDLGLTVADKYYTLHSVAPLVRGVRRSAASPSLWPRPPASASTALT